MVINPYEGLVSPFSGMNEQRRKRRKHSAGVAGGWQFPGASFDLDFANGRYFGDTLANLLATSRASSGYVENSDGTLTFVAPNLSRIGVGNGLFCGIAHTNLVANSQDFPTWGKDNSANVQTVVTGDTTIAPDGTLTADTLSTTIITGPANCEVFTLSPITSGANYALSVFVKKGTADKVALILEGDVNFAFVAKVFDLTNGTLGETVVGANSGALASASIVSVANGFFKISMIASIVANNAYMVISQAAALFGNTYNNFGDIQLPTSYTGTVVLWQADYIKSNYLSVPVKSAGGTSAGAADVNTGLAGLLAILDSNVGTVLVKTLNYPNQNNNSAEVAGGGARQLIGSNSSGGTTLAEWNGSSNLIATLGSGDTRTTVCNAALSWDGTGRSLVANNGTVATDGGSVGTATGTAYIGAYGGGANNQMDGYIQRLTVWNSRLSDAALKALTV